VEVEVEEEPSRLFMQKIASSINGEAMICVRKAMMKE